MMKLSLMRDVCATLDAQWHSPIADVILSRWAHDADRAVYVRASANFLFWFKCVDQGRFLRFNHAHERTRDAILAEIDFLDFLAALGVNVAKPIRSLTGEWVESIETTLGTFHAVVFEGLPGKQLEIDELPPAMFGMWGKALGELHAAAEGYAGTGRPSWRDQLETVSGFLPANETSARHALVTLQAQLDVVPTNVNNFGVIHFDFELDNLLWYGDRFGIVDFDDCAWNWHAADIALAVGRYLFDDDPTRVDLDHVSLRAFVDGYRTAKDIGEHDLGRLSLFLRLHNLVLFAKLLRAIDAGDRADEPTWLQELRQKLNDKVQRLRDGFANAV